MSYENILLERSEDGIYTLTINRPDKLNALNSAVLGEIHAAGEKINNTPDARVLLVTGAGDKAFVAGADIKEMQNKNAIEAQALSKLGMRAFRRLETLPIPVIAVVNGYCLGGGCELALGCDWIIASDNAVFGQPEVNLGVMPGFGGSQRLPRRIGSAKAMEMLVTGRQLKATEALVWGLVNHVYPANELMDRALETAREITKKGPFAVQLVKEAVCRGQDMDLPGACSLESQMFGLCFSTKDQKEGMQAFLEKRRAEFKGK